MTEGEKLLKECGYVLDQDSRDHKFLPSITYEIPSGEDDVYRYNILFMRTVEEDGYLASVSCFGIDDASGGLMNVKLAEAVYIRLKELNGGE